MGGHHPIIQDGYFLGEKSQGETRILRHKNLKPEEPLPQCLKTGEDTCLKVFLKTYNEKKNVLFMGSREVIGDQQGKFKWITYEHAYLESIDFAKGIEALQLCPLYDNCKFLGIFSNNRIEWVITDIACWQNSYTLIPFITGTDAESFRHIFAQSQLSTIIVSGINFQKVFDVFKKGFIKPLKNIIVFDIVEDELIKQAIQENLKIFHYKDVLEAGRKSNLPLNPCNSDTIFTLCYTSGTTSLPKGVMLSHKNIVAAIVAFIYGNYFDISRIKTLISILPLAHIFERLVFVVMIYAGVKAGFFCGDIEKIMMDFQEIKPNMIIGVPRLFQRFNAKIESEFAKLTGFKSWLVKRALRVKLANLKNKKKYSHYVYDKLVFNKIRNAFGGEIKALISASAPIDGSLLENLKIIFGCQFMQGYGQTETGGPVSISYDYDPNPTSNGPPCLTCEIKLVDVPDMEYFSTYMKDGKNLPRGEICCRGPGMCLGYYKEIEKTKELFDKDGWLHTGDIGEILEEGTLKIIDRKKNIFKLSQGEYIAPEKIENILTLSKYVAQVFVEGNSLRNFLVAIIYPQKDPIIEYAKEHNLNGTFEELVENYEINKIILQDIRALSKEKKLNSLETVAKIHLISKPFSLENNLLTPTFKLKRFQARKTFEKEVDLMYSGLEEASPSKFS